MKGCRSDSTATRKSTERFSRGNTEGEDIVLVLEVLQKRFRKEQVLVSRSTATKSANNSKPGRKEKYNEEDQTEGEKNSDDKEAAILPSAFMGVSAFLGECFV